MLLNVNVSSRHDVVPACLFTLHPWLPAQNQARSQSALQEAALLGSLGDRQGPAEDGTAEGMCEGSGILKGERERSGWKRSTYIVNV